MHGEYCTAEFLNLLSKITVSFSSISKYFKTIVGFLVYAKLLNKNMSAGFVVDRSFSKENQFLSMLQPLG